jgi:hypothetical protein
MILFGGIWNVGIERTTLKGFALAMGLISFMLLLRAVLFKWFGEIYYDLRIENDNSLATR